MSDYRICTHAEVADKAGFLAALSALERLTFSHYDGVVPASPDFLRWYTARPGMNPGLCQAAFAGEGLVSSVFVTLAPMVVGGDVAKCGLVDTVMTHPGHRRRGLARTLLRRVLDAMASEGADISLLYTARADPPLPPERLYRSLGYTPRETVTRLVRPPGHIGAGQPTEMFEPDEAARRVFEEALGRRDGWLVLDDDLWRWRRQRRPREYPVSLHGTKSGAAAAICRGELLVSGLPRGFGVIGDLVLPEGGPAPDALRALVSSVPAEAAATLLCPESDARTADLLRGLGFASAGLEMAMLRPVTERGRRALRSPRPDWYVAVESLIGV